MIQGSNSNSQVDINRLNQLVLTSSKTSSINSRASSTATSLAGSEVDDNFSDSDETNKKPKRKKVMEIEQPKLVAVFHHFELVKNSKGKQKYKCKLCNCSRSGTNGSDSNLRTHINRKVSYSRTGKDWNMQLYTYSIKTGKGSKLIRDTQIQNAYSQPQ